ncbi:MAG: SprB repeat-containing protein, partial [Bacteroidetes bacterium]|nr:SprB repeat-containing protein [Bacteroidota bacterium]
MHYIIGTENNTTGIFSRGYGNWAYSVTDANNCTGFTGSVSVGQPSQLSGTSHIDTYVSCEGLCDGIVTVTATGGTSPYRYALNGGSWSLPTASPYIFTGLCAATYTAHIMDNNSCTGDVVFTMVQSYYGPKAQFGTIPGTCPGQQLCIPVEGKDLVTGLSEVCAISLKFTFDHTKLSYDHAVYNDGTLPGQVPWTDHVNYGYNNLHVTLDPTNPNIIRIGGTGQSFGFPGTPGLLVTICFNYIGGNTPLTWVDDGNNK